MESSLQVVKPLPHSQISVPTIQMDRIQTASPVRLAKLPPISDPSAQADHPSTVFLQSATSELKDTMQHLLSEVRMSAVIIL